jgi:hypothetical protein
MYLHARRYVGSSGLFDERDPAIYGDLVKTFELEKLTEGVDLPSAEVSVKVAYWRKANQIHRWFVESVQGGEDDCRPYNVSKEQLGDLGVVCRRLLSLRKTAGEPAARRAAREELPSQGGFFFGLTEADTDRLEEFWEGYWRDLEETVAQIDRVLANLDRHWELEYEASW